MARDDEYAEAVAGALGDDVSDTVAEHLAAARGRALAERASAPPAWRSFAVAAAICGLAITLTVAGLRAPVDDAGATIATPTAPLLEGVEPALAEDIDLLQDLEFVAWLEQEALLDAS